MKRLKSFTYFEPTTLKEASDILAEKGDQAYPLAGGTDLLVRMKREEISPSVLVNLKRIAGLNKIREENGGGAQIGALATISAIEGSPLIRSAYPVLAEAAGVLGSPSIRNLGTLGGNVGRASPASDMIPSLMILGARVAVEGAHGTRETDLQDLFSGPGTTTLSRGEIITSFCLPEMPPFSGASYEKLGRREGVDIALVGVAVLLALGEKDTGAVAAKVALGAVAPVPVRAGRAEEVLLSGPLTEERLRQASRAAVEDASPITDIRASGLYRKEMVRVLTYRALGRALTFARGGKTH